MKKLVCSAVTMAMSIALLVVVTSGPAVASDWTLIGPDGGNVRSLTYDPSDPNRILLGTSAGQLFVSHDGGNSWAPFAHLGSGDDLVIDHIVFDPTNTKTIYAAGWGLYHDDEGDVFRSDDGGLTWRSLAGVHGKSIRALAMAPSDHNTLMIGALDGVFRSRDGGATWERMTPENPEVLENHASMKNFVSVAIDPLNPDVVYAGTRHLAWKTSNGGQNWHNIKDGMLDDSDVFSIIVDPNTPSRVYASACSGIYKSDNGADLFHRVQGMPHSAIRTRVLKQDPKRPSIVYAGTTGGLWKTLDGGARWKLVSAADVTINDILIDPRNPERVLLATDRGGVLASDNGFENYHTSNRGFVHRAVVAMMTDRSNPNRIYAGVVNDRDLGGFFSSDDTGQSWKLWNKGLNERDVLALQQDDTGVIYAGTNHGIFYLTSLTANWMPAAMYWGEPLEWQKKVEEPPAPQYKSAGKSKTAKAAPARTTTVAKKPPAVHETPIPIALAPRIRSLQITDHGWYAATNEGIFISLDNGKKWYGQAVLGEKDLIAVDRTTDGVVTVVTPKRAFASGDGGKTWTELTVPDYVTVVYDLESAPDSSLWLSTRQGALHSTDGGKTWNHTLGGLPSQEIQNIHYDSVGKRLLATAVKNRSVFESEDGGKTWNRTPDAIVTIRSAVSYQGRILAATKHNGLLLEQKGVQNTGEVNSAKANNSTERSATARQ